MRLPKQFLYCLAFLIIATAQFPTLRAETARNWEKRFNHALGIEFQIPSDYELLPEFLHQYTDGESFIRFWWAAESNPDEGSNSLNDRCAQFQWTWFTFEVIREVSPAICTIVARDGNTYAIVFPDQAHTTSRRQSYTALVIGAPPNNLLPIAESIHFARTIAPILYLEETLRLIKANYVYRSQVDWLKIYSTARLTVDADSTLNDAHQALLWVFEQLANVSVGSHRGALLMPAQPQANTWATGISMHYPDQSPYPIIDMIYPNSPAAAAGLRVGDRIEQINGTAVSQANQRAIGTGSTLQLTVKRGGEAHTISLSPQAFDSYLPSIGQRLDNHIGYLETFTLDTSSPVAVASAYAAQTQELIRQIDQTPVCGWIIDVRRNRGGQIAGMSAALAPLIGDGSWISDRLADGTVVQGGYYQGQWQSFAGGQVVNSQTMIPQPYYLRHYHLPVALLVSSETTSMGEISVFLFQQRNHGSARVFGEPTRGLLSDGIIDFTLFDGAIVRIVDRVLLDANGHPAPHHIEPDVYIETDYTVYGTDTDPVIQSASRWLQAQPECSGTQQFVSLSPDAGSDAGQP